ncbi:hypothetical protein COLO4_05996 [Corchorus olitorius]|uniref:Uncharacterized protein n=1 Tax=Corchorus olitorius TaxID=93759 RepID=A0A1R3KP92_9ROSI|nr:hypothetical protein COLO4_05996 [Corchorus olitorius]
MNLSRCKKFRKIPNLLGAKRLESIWSRDCLSLVQLPFMTHLISLKSINLSNCPITKFPEVEGLIELQELYLNDTKIQEVPSFIGSLKKLKWLGLSGTNIRELNLKATPTSPIQDVKKLVASASSIPSLQCIRQLDVRKCKSLERVTFADHGDEDHSWDWDEEFLFDECNKLNDASRDNIIAHVMIRIQSRAKQWAKQLAEKSTDVISDNSYAHSVHCRFPGSVISDKFVNWRNLDSGPTRNRDFNVWVTLKSGSVADTDSTRFLCFALCLVLHRKNKRGLSFFINCDYQLNGTHGKYQNSRKNSFSIPKFSSHGEHVHVLFREDMILRDKGYKEASFSFPFHTRRDYISVKNCGVHVLSVDAESFTVTPVSCTNENGQVETCMPSTRDSSLKLLSSIITRQKLNSYYGDGSSSKASSNMHYNNDEISGLPIKSSSRADMQSTGPQKRGREDTMSSAPSGRLEEDHEHVFLRENESFDAENSIRTKRCFCGFSIQVEEL